MAIFNSLVQNKLQSMPIISLYKERLKKIKDVPIKKTVYILEREYGITTAADKRPYLATGGIVGFEKNGCIGILISDTKNKLASLAHLFDNQIFSQAFDTIIVHLEKYGLKQFECFIIRPTENPDIANQILSTQNKYHKNKKLISPFQRISELDIVFDTRKNILYESPINLHLPYEEIKYYGNRKIISGSIFNATSKQLDCCYEPKNH